MHREGGRMKEGHGERRQRHGIMYKDNACDFVGS